jgi:hypothetical protein
MNVGQAFGGDQESLLRDFTDGVRAHTPPPQHPPDDLVVGVEHAGEAIWIGGRPPDRVLGFWHRLAVGHSLSPQTDYLLCAPDLLLITKSNRRQENDGRASRGLSPQKGSVGDHLCHLRA